MMKQRYFHISDIFSVVTRSWMSTKEELTAPDGYKIDRNSAGSGVIDLCEFVSGINMHSPENTRHFHEELLYEVGKGVARSIMGQKGLEWVQELEYPDETLPTRSNGATEEAFDKFLSDFMKATAQKHGVDEWVLVNQDKLPHADLLNKQSGLVSMPKVVIS